MIEAIFSTRHAMVEQRRELVAKYVAQGSSKAEAERQMVIVLFRRAVRHLSEKKKIPAERLMLAVGEALVEEVMES
jgi:hypothetical protein